ncbi:hypothetical protein QJU89_07600 [Pasteurella skyensis]|uniref:Uncharacterized protein n=1 Tax=Phocoenobacter skyensis TaxID=97481 RepID=A0AAJ6N9W6_9PAST|nr:hypothetical protein [Pasteurella skyensis]MDP8162945.1 hypothetical protein [Pasteurella skyensis]MDP8172903.1 hypothetical protein [Pasteurella skyensis]MDP8176651.1 hypothetical protein [Pasteurella skyensis]MDP8179403.1 hypothetical protein [Pasteurella skyensis]MDP8183555.1 hypothetical protein [Pasteurella skyensis]
MQQILLKINNFNIDTTIDDYDIDVTEFFDEIALDLEEIDPLTEQQKKDLIDALFGFIECNPSDMQEDFSFIHLIESIDAPDYAIYDLKLIEINTKIGSKNTLLLLYRHINSLDVNEKKKYLPLLENIAKNTSYNNEVRELALELYEYQLEN